MPEVSIVFYGPLKKWGEGCRLNLVEGADVQAVRAALSQEMRKTAPEFPGENVLREVALATEARILRDGDVITMERELAALPPVCGG